MRNIDYDPGQVFWIRDRRTTKIQKQAPTEEQPSQMSELDGHIQLTDMRLVRYLKEQVSLKEELQNELQQENLSPGIEAKINEALSIVDQNIQKVRMSSILN
jgi:hypothetical protein